MRVADRKQPPAAADDLQGAWFGSSLRELLTVPAVIFLASRVLLAILARAASSLLPVLRTSRTYLPASDPLASIGAWVRPWTRFDAKWYVDVAQHGYRYGTVPRTNTNFFPLYPLAVRLIQPLSAGSYWVAAFVVAQLSFFLALVVLWRWARAKWEKQIAIRTVILVAVFPFAFFYMAPYAEPMFLALAAGAFLAAEKGHWRWAAVCAGLSAVTRPVGLAVVAALIVWAVQQRDWRRALLAATGVLPFLAFVTYLAMTVGHPLAFTVYHTAGWVRPHGGSLVDAIGMQFHTSLSPFDRVDAAVSLLFLVCGIAVWRRLGAPYGLYVLLGVLLPLSRSLGGMERYVIVLFPVMALWATARHGLHMAVFAISVLLLCLATVMFASGYALF